MLKKNNFSMSTSPLSAYVDFSNLRLGDRMASAWYAQHRRLRTGERFGALDNCLLIPEPFPMSLYFPDTFVAIDQEEINSLALRQWDQTVLWLNTTNEFAKSPANGFFEHIPEQVHAAAARIAREKKASRPRVLMHILDDAGYNFARNWRREDALATARALERKGCDVVLLNPERARFICNYQGMLAHMLAADAFIGGDTGPSHVFAQLCAHKPQIAIYPDMSGDRETYRPLQESLGLSVSWSSLPKKNNLAVITLTEGRVTTRSGIFFKRRKYQRFYSSDVLGALLPLLHERY